MFKFFCLVTWNTLFSDFMSLRENGTVLGKLKLFKVSVCIMNTSELHSSDKIGVSMSNLKKVGKLESTEKAQEVNL